MNLSILRVAITGGTKGFPDTLFDKLVKIAETLEDDLRARGKKIPTLPYNPPGPFVTGNVARGSDTAIVYEQITSRLPYKKTNVTMRELIDHINSLAWATTPDPLTESNQK